MDTNQNNQEQEKKENSGCGALILFALTVITLGFIIYTIL
jgi:hypothetical protein